MSIIKDVSHTGHNTRMLNALIESKNGLVCYWYLRDVGHNDQVLNTLIESKDGFVCNH